MILSKTVTVRLSGRKLEVEHYESLGYYIPKYRDSNGILHIKRTDIIVKVEHLTIGSMFKILVRCDNPNCHHGQDGNKGEHWITYQCYQTQIKIRGQYYCRVCAHNTPEFKVIISKIHKGKKETQETRNKKRMANIGENNPMFGKTQTKKSKKQMSITKRKTAKRGKDHHSWDSSITMEERLISKNRNLTPGYSTFITTILRKDDQECQICGNTEHLCVHHKNNFNDFKEQRVDPNNGITLCKHCHTLFHKMFSRKHTTENDWNEFIKMIVMLLMMLPYHSFDNQ